MALQSASAPKTSAVPTAGSPARKTTDPGRRPGPVYIKLITNVRVHSRVRRILSTVFSERALGH
ncbi:hypothetical protein PG985_014932 [Apiospora marii]|uniref:Uncharacterized protein n=1 Tax=Apiospora marii TaxID=335849 RepID=A0ABR1RKX4_9PEZI